MNPAKLEWHKHADDNEYREGLYLLRGGLLAKHKPVIAECHLEDNWVRTDAPPIAVWYVNEEDVDPCYFDEVALLMEMKL